MRTNETTKTIRTVNHESNGSAMGGPVSRFTTPRLAKMFLLLLVMAFPSMATAAQRTKFTDGQPTVRSGFAVRNGCTVWLSGKLAAAGGSPVPNAVVSLYLNVDRKEFKIANVRTDRYGRFGFGQKIALPLGSVPISGKTIAWAAEFAPTRGDFLGATTRNYIAGWGFRVVP